MRGSKQDLPIVMELPDGEIRSAKWGSMIVELGSTQAEVDATPYFRGLPDDRCQCPHWGYVLKGRMRLRFADREEVYAAGDAYHAPAGHTPILEAGTEYIEFSPAEAYRQTMEMMEKAQGNSDSAH